ncbi:glycosyltransferase family 39 protein [bacterium]|nr:glycosyltransferase family 39 protein [bacterium]
MSLFPLKQRQIILFLFLSALIMRVLFQLLFWGFGSPVVDDGRDYHRIAVNLIETGTFQGKTGTTARRPPLYPFFIAAIYSVTSPNPDAVRLVQIVLNAALVIWIYLFGRQVYGTRVGLLAGLLAVFYPVFVFLPARLLTENLFVILVFLVSWFLIRYARRSALHYFLGGTLLGLAILTRPALMMAPLFIAIWILGYASRFRTASIRFIALVLGMSCVIAPWTLRNYFLFHQFVPVTTNAGITFLHDNNPFVPKMGWAGPQNRIFQPELISPEFAPENEAWQELNEAQQDQAYFNYTLNWIKQNPIEFLKLLPRKLISYLNFRQGSNTAELSTVLMDLANLFSYGLLLPFMLIGFGWTFRHESPAQRLVHFLIATFVLGVMIYAGGVRLRVPIEPFLVLFAAYTLVSLFEQLRPHALDQLMSKIER